MGSVATGGFSTDLGGVLGVVGRQLGPTEWATMTQGEVDRFAELTGDFNPIHVDPAHAAQTMFGGTIAHGFLSLSLLAPVTQLLEVSDASTSVNYGLEKVRFPAPLKVGALWRGRAEVTEVSEIKGGVQAKLTATLEVKDAERPVVVAESIVRFYA
jgi:acyl dehydratase